MVHVPNVSSTTESKLATGFSPDVGVEKARCFGSLLQENEMQMNTQKIKRVSCRLMALALTLCTACGIVETDMKASMGGSGTGETTSAQEGTTGVETVGQAEPKDSGLSGGLSSGNSEGDTAATSDGTTSDDEGELASDSAPPIVIEVVASEEAHAFGFYRYVVEVHEKGQWADISVRGAGGKEVSQVLAYTHDEQTLAFVVPPVCLQGEKCSEDAAPMTVFIHEDRDGIQVSRDGSRTFLYTVSDDVEDNSMLWVISAEETYQLRKLTAVLSDLAGEAGMDERCNWWCRFKRGLRRAICVLQGAACCVNNPWSCISKCTPAAVACWKAA